MYKYNVKLYNSCGPGKISAGDKRCVDKNECLEKPCLNNGFCENLGPESLYGYRCICATGYLGHNCELHQQEQSIQLGLGALAAILVCILLISGKWREILHVYLASLKFVFTLSVVHPDCKSILIFASAKMNAA